MNELQDMMKLVDALDDGGDSGYSSDRDDSSGSDETGFSTKADFGSCSGDDEDDCSINSVSNSSTCSSSPLSEAFSLNPEEEEESPSEKIFFLREKGEVLQRATRLLEEEKSLDVLITHRMSKSGRKEAEPPIWGEAKHMLSLLSRRNIGGPCVSFAPLPPLPTASHKRLRPMAMERQTKRRRIDTSIVSHVKSSSHCKNTDGGMGGYEETMWKTNMFRDFHMTSDDQDQSTITRIKLSSESVDTILDSVKGHARESREEENVVPNPSVGLEEALLITDKPMLLAKSSAPFSVVHTNGAFINLSGMCPEALVGKPVESVVISGSSYVRQAMNALQPNKTTNASIQEKKCRIRAVPVCAGGEKAVSHLLITIEAATNLTRLADALFDTSDIHSKEGCTITRGPSQGVIGTIG